MSLTISDYSMSGDNTRHTARLISSHPQAWEVSWLPGQLLDRNAAITAMVLADVAGSRALQAGDRIWPHIKGWAAEIGLTAADALARVSQPSSRMTADKDRAALPDPQAAG